MDTLSKALDEVSYEWLMANHPSLIEALDIEVQRGAIPSRIKQFVLAQTQRWELALRCEQAARHIQRENTVVR